MRRLRGHHLYSAAMLGLMAVAWLSPASAAQRKRAPDQDAAYAEPQPACTAARPCYDVEPVRDTPFAYYWRFDEYGVFHPFGWYGPNTYRVPRFRYQDQHYSLF